MFALLSWIYRRIKSELHIRRLGAATKRRDKPLYDALDKAEAHSRFDPDVMYAFWRNGEEFHHAPMTEFMQRRSNDDHLMWRIRNGRTLWGAE